MNFPQIAAIDLGELQLVEIIGCGCGKNLCIFGLFGIQQIAEFFSFILCDARIILHAKIVVDDLAVLFFHRTVDGASEG